MTALRLILRRAAIVVPLLLAVTVVVFLIVQLLPGDPATAVLGEFASKEQRAEFAAANGLNDPLPDPLRALPRRPPPRRPRGLADERPGGRSSLLEKARAGDDPADAAGDAAGRRSTRSSSASCRPSTAARGSTSSAARCRSAASPRRRSGSASCWCRSSRWSWGCCRPGGYLPMSAGLGPWLEAMILPASALALSTGSTLVRVVRASVLQELERDYVRTARAGSACRRTVVDRPQRCCATR